MPTLRHKNYRSLYHPTLPKLAACKIQQHFFFLLAVETVNTGRGSGGCPWPREPGSGCALQPRAGRAKRQCHLWLAVAALKGTVLHTFSQFGHQTVDTLSEETEASIVSILLQRIPSAGVWQTSLASRITCCQGREMAVIGKAVH